MDERARRELILQEETRLKEEEVRLQAEKDRERAQMVKGFAWLRSKMCMGAWTTWTEFCETVNAQKELARSTINKILLRKQNAVLEKWRDYASTRIAKQEEKAAAELAEKQAQEEEERLERVREETHA